MPPTNSCDILTDEDSGDDDDVNVNNLPPSQLRAEAELFEQNSDDEWEDEDKIPLFELRNQLLSKKRYDDIKKKKYYWEKQDIENSCLDLEWPNFCLPSNNLSPISLFENYLDQEIIDMFVTCTNMYAATKNRRSDITAEEIKVFFGILLLSGYMSTPRRRMFWENSPDSHNDIVSDSMSRNRFEHILANIHCCDNNNLDKNDRFAKVRPFFNKINSRFLDFAPIEQFHCVDEAMVPYFGRHGCKQFIRGKPLRYGYKLWVGASASGYIAWYEPYQGAKSEIKDCYKNLGLGPSVVLEYTDVLLSKYKLPYSIYFDNFFTTLPLIEVLTEKGVKGTGTIRKNRLANCQLDSDEKLKKNRGDFDWKVSSQKSIIVVKWSDNNMVHMVSNFYGVFPLHPVTRYSQKQKMRIPVKQPQNIKKYNTNMGGVDRSDQNISLYRIAVRGKKWYFPLITHLLDAAEQNAWQLHRKQGGKLDHLAFRRNVAMSLIQSNREDRGLNLHRRLNRPSPLENVESRYDRLDHLIEEQDRQTRCRVCHKKVSTRCRKCNVTLHVRCFISYHTRS